QHELDSVSVRSSNIAAQGIYPAVELMKTRSPLLTTGIVGDWHYVLSVQVQALLREYESLKNGIGIIRDNDLSQADRADYAKAQKLIKYFTQDVHVTEDISGKPGEYVTRDDMLKGVEEILI